MQKTVRITRRNGRKKSCLKRSQRTARASSIKCTSVILRTTWKLCDARKDRIAGAQCGKN
uniref:Uncharacterized protein n=1 Tax=Hyaloperonospora arabidopsidis (strain Emoy2) TaxID=559515 RepID=M4C4H9_HYAAE